MNDSVNDSESHWVPVSGGTDLAPSSARAVSVAGLDIVIWRSEAGAVQAWENRCPHRGMRLSFGQVRGDKLVCRYHGWAFDQAGQCRSIPASPDTAPPPTACVATYACREALGLIWVTTTTDNMADDESALRALVDQSGFDDAALFCKTIYVDGQIEDFEAIIDDKNLFIALQQCTPNRAAIHIVARSSGDAAADITQRLNIARRAQRLRRHLANPETSTTRQEIRA